MSSPDRRAPQRAEPNVASAKQSLRETIRRARRAPETPAAAQARAALALAASAGIDTVACYASIGTEPDTWPLIDALYAQGAAVLLPVLTPLPDGTPRRRPDWARYAGRAALRPGLWGIPEPDTVPLGSEAIAQAGLVWCSGLAGTPAGDRLGMGGGWFDRALAEASESAWIGLLLRDAEVLPFVPTETLDHRVDLIVTEHRLIAVSGGRVRE